MLRTIQNWLIPDALRKDGEAFGRANRVIAFDLALCFFGPIFSTIFWVLGAPISSAIVDVAMAALMVNLVYLRSGGNLQVCGHVVTAVAWFTYTSLACFNGGHHSAPAMWYVTVPVFAIALCGTRAGVLWTLASVAAIVTFYVARENGFTFPDEATVSGKRFLEFSGLLGVLTCVYFLMSLFKWMEHNAQQAITAALAKAQAADRAKSEFLANMSHEIRTPMTAILGFADYLDDSALDRTGAQDALQTIKRNGEHLLAIINDILDLSKIESGKLVIEQVRCSPRQIVADVIELLQVRIAAKGLAATTHFDPRVPLHVLTDPTRLRQIVLNLVSNAVKFTETGGVQVIVRWRDQNKSRPLLQIDVVDTGIGMTSDHVSRLFQPFTQADSSTTRRFGGSGLGLAISHRLAEMLGGTITVSSVCGAGSTFQLLLPTPALAADGSTDSLRSGDSALRRQQKEPNRQPLTGRRLLLAEDAPDNQRLIMYVLRKAGADVTLAENGAVACELSLAAHDEGKPFDVVLMDMQMPIVDGYQAVKQLRLAGYHEPIIALTAHSMGSDRQVCLDAGCDDFATKPIDRARLISLIGDYCQQGSRQGTEPIAPV
ncbi:MAG TPA: ATP-binding protein [Planctomycetaceae bacterium]|jgi:signal transduction histidine kinase|nr:ATP-binding protein [Planctomycetaceae bacterium]